MRKRNIAIPIRVTEDELALIDTKAKKARLTRTEYLISCAVEKQLSFIEDLRGILSDLKRISNKLTQLTRLANSGKIKVVSLAESCQALEEIYKDTHKLSQRRFNSTNFNT